MTLVADNERVKVGRLLARVPVTLRALVLLPLLAAGLDQVRATLVCAPGARSCLDAAGHGWLGGAGVLVLVLYAAGLAVLVARLARSRRSLWALGTAGLWAACGGQVALVSALGTGSSLGGGWLSLLALGVVAGALLALALSAARRLALVFAPLAPRLVAARALSWQVPPPVAAPAREVIARLARDRAPPLAA